MVQILSYITVFTYICLYEGVESESI